MLSEQHPELGLSGNGLVTYSSYDAGGNVGRKDDDRANLTYTYDDAQRLTHVHEGDGAGRLLNRRLYGSPNSGGNYKLGKLVETSRINYVVAPSTLDPIEYPIELTEAYRYQNSAGRVSERTLEVQLTGMPSFSTTYDYDSYGNVAQIGYPRCTDAAGYPGHCPSNDPARSLLLQYNRSQLTAIPGFLTEMTYHPNGMVHEVSHANGNTDVHIEDPWDMRRPRHIYNSIFHELFDDGQSLPENHPNDPRGLGPYEYDGAGDDLDYMHARYCNPNLGRSLGIDPVGGAVKNSQTWNRYSYVLNNPLAFVDPSGMYEVSCTDGDAACQQAAEAFEAARQENLKSRLEEVRATAEAYGDPGEKNGVTVGFSALESGEGARLTAQMNFVDGEGFSLQVSVIFNPSIMGSQLVAAVAHEGQHLLDAQAFAATLTDAGPGDLSKNLTFRELETRAYGITHLVLRTKNDQVRYRARGRGGAVTLGNRATPQAKVDRLIERIVEGPLYQGKLDRRQFAGYDN